MLINLNHLLIAYQSKLLPKSILPTTQSIWSLNQSVCFAFKEVDTFG